MWEFFWLFVLTCLESQCYFMTTQGVCRKQSSFSSDSTSDLSMPVLKSCGYVGLWAYSCQSRIGHFIWLAVYPADPPPLCSQSRLDLPSGSMLYCMCHQEDLSDSLSAYVLFCFQSVHNASFNFRISKGWPLWIRGYLIWWEHEDIFFSNSFLLMDNQLLYELSWTALTRVHQRGCIKNGNPLGNRTA